MSGFTLLRDISKKFESDLRSVSTEFFSTKDKEAIEDVVAKSLKDIALYSAKLRLMRGMRISESPQITQQNKSLSSILSEYSDTAASKVIEQQVVKAVTQSHVIKKLITTPNSQLHPELVERKEKIISQVTKYAEEESQLRRFEENFMEKEEQLLMTRRIWDETLCQLKNVEKTPENVEITNGPLYKKLQNLVNKMEIMRWLIAKLVTSRTSDYDWAADPHRRLKALALARQSHTIQYYTES